MSETILSTFFFFLKTQTHTHPHTLDVLELKDICASVSFIRLAVRPEGSHCVQKRMSAHVRARACVRVRTGTPVVTLCPNKLKCSNVT